MTRTLIIFLFVVLSQAAKSQVAPQAEKECRLISGIGFAGATKNTQSKGNYVWLQLGYRLLENISVATEFENMTYKLSDHFISLPPELRDVSVVDNNFSFLLKYHLPVKSPIKIALTSGWTYTIRSSESYFIRTDDNLQSFTRHVSSYDDYQIPFMLELEYPLWKTINVHARARYNSNPQKGSTYASGLGLSLKL